MANQVTCCHHQHGKKRNWGPNLTDGKASVKRFYPMGSVFFMFNIILRQPLFTIHGSKGYISHETKCNRSFCWAIFRTTHLWDQIRGTKHNAETRTTIWRYSCDSCVALFRKTLLGYLDDQHLVVWLHRLQPYYCLKKKKASTFLGSG